MSTEALSNNVDTQFTLSLLSNETALQPWSLNDSRDRSGTGYVQRYRNSYSRSAQQVRVIQEVEQAGFYEASETDYSHSFLISVYSDVQGSESSDLLTTFGVDAATGIMVVGELVNPTLDLDSPGVQERLARYGLRGIDVQDSSAQQQALLQVLGA